MFIAPFCRKIMTAKYVTLKRTYILQLQRIVLWPIHSGCVLDLVFTSHLKSRFVKVLDSSNDHRLVQCVLEISMNTARPKIKIYNSTRTAIEITRVYFKHFGSGDFKKCWVFFRNQMWCFCLKHLHRVSEARTLLSVLSTISIKWRAYAPVSSWPIWKVIGGPMVAILVFVGWK